MSSVVNHRMLGRSAANAEGGRRKAESSRTRARMKRCMARVTTVEGRGTCGRNVAKRERGHSCPQSKNPALPKPEMRQSNTADRSVRAPFLEARRCANKVY